MKILIVKGQKVLIDDCDYELFSSMGWTITCGYVALSSRRNGFKSLTKMHRIVIGAKEGEITDHIDRDKLNNQRYNLRIVTKEGNVHNQDKRQGTENNYKGVMYLKEHDAYQSRCRMLGGDHYLGLFKSEIAAAHAYNIKATQLSNTVCLNKLPYNIKRLDKMLITDRVKMHTSDNYSPVAGVYFKKRGGRSKYGKWVVRHIINGNRVWLGAYLNKADAEQKSIETIHKYGLDPIKLNLVYR